MNIFYASRDSGRTHFAKDQIWLGSVKSYNLLSGKVACWLGKGFKLDINGQKQYFNKNSFLKTAHQGLGISSLAKSELKSISEIESLQPRFNLPTNTRLKTMNDCLSRNAKIKLTKKLFETLINGQFVRAHQLVGQGANLNQMFYVEDGKKKWKYNFKDKLPNVSKRTKVLEFKATQYSPMLYAAKHQKYDLAAFMRKAGAVDLKGEIVEFKRTLLSEEKINSFLYGKGVISHYHDKSVRTHKTTLGFSGTYQEITLYPKVIIEDNRWDYTRFF